MQLKIPQLAVAKIGQLGRHETLNIRSEHYSPSVEGSIPRGNFFAGIFLLYYNSGRTSNDPRLVMEKTTSKDFVFCLIQTDNTTAN